MVMSGRRWSASRFSRADLRILCALKEAACPGWQVFRVVQYSILEGCAAHRLADMILKLHKWALISYFRDNYLNNRGDWFNLSRPVDSMPEQEYRRGGRVAEGARLESV